jgi:hypothetical protein
MTGVEAYHKPEFIERTLAFLVDQGLGDKDIHTFLELLGMGIGAEQDTYYESLKVIREEKGLKPPEEAVVFPRPRVASVNLPSRYPEHFGPAGRL